MKLHVCGPWEYGAPLRLLLLTKNWSIMLGARSQGWSPRSGYLDTWHFFTRAPRRICGQDLGPGMFVCSRRAQHGGDHSGLSKETWRGKQ